MQIATKTVVVTGAGSGIGRELTLQLLRKGGNVAGVDINPQALKETCTLAKTSEERLRTFVVDITDKQQVDRLPAEVIQHFGSVDGLINNAGIIQHFKSVNELTLDEIERVVNVNFYGTLFLTKAFLPHFLQRPVAHIANVSSMGGFLPVPGQTLYGAAKAAVKLFTEGLYAELVDTNVGVTVVFPGAIDTNITENSGLGKPKSKADVANSKLKPMPASKAAEQIINAIERDLYRAVVGSDARVLDWLYRFNPRYATNFIQKKMKALRPM